MCLNVHAKFITGKMCTLGWPFNALYEKVMISLLSIYWQWFV